MKAEKQDRTYDIVRFYREPNKSSRVFKKRVTLAEAQAHCKDPKTSNGQYFDGYRVR